MSNKITLICHFCYLRRNNMYQWRDKKNHKIMGYVCQKCANKHLIRQEMAKHKELRGLSWRNAIKRFLAGGIGNDEPKSIFKQGLSGLHQRHQDKSNS